ncbi:MAG: tetratricopeptide repeat protein [Deltaproteobacteria bacterium]|nr:tetratricopeptide repeat protein [Deltaproteobacteria bacterium]
MTQNESQTDLQAQVEELRQWFESNPQDASAVYKLALLLLELEEFDDALEYAEQCAVLAPVDTNALKLLGMARDYNGLVSEAEKILRRAVEIEPADADAWLCLGAHFFQNPLKDYKQALEHFSKACAMDTTNSQAQMCRAEALEKLGRRSEARSAYLLSLQADHENLTAVKELAMLEIQEENLEKAADLLRVYLKEAPDDRDARWTLERILKRIVGG